MLQLLEKRAVALKSANFKKADEIELEMTHYKNENFEKITTPNTAYITFKHEGILPTLLKLFDECDEEGEE